MKSVCLSTVAVLLVTMTLATWTQAADSLATPPVASAPTATAPSSGPATTAVGWRQNWTGVFPSATPPTQWSRVPTNSVVRSLLCTSTKPAGEDKPAAEGATPMGDGFIRNWLVLGPFQFEKDERPLAKAYIDEAAIQPAAGDAAGDLKWKAMTASLPNWAAHFQGSMNPNWIDLVKSVEPAKGGMVVYAQAYIFSPKGGKVRILTGHAGGEKLFLNGKEIYSAAKESEAYLWWHHYSRFKLAGLDPASAAIDTELAKGWNRLLVKAVSDADKKNCQIDLRLYDNQELTYEEKNIAWVCPMPDAGNGNPVIVGDKVFVTAEPNELICVDKTTGKIRWQASNSYYDALTDEEKAANPVFKEKIDPAAAALRAAKTHDERVAARAKLLGLLKEFDPANFPSMPDVMADHPIGHFGVTGWATPTPVSDGKFVYVAFGHGVTACYSLDGKRQWIRRLDKEVRDAKTKEWPIGYPASPTMIGDKLFIEFCGTFALDAKTGKTLWHSGAGTTAAAIPAQIKGVDVIVVGCGNTILRASDGKILKTAKGSGVSWSAPVYQEGFLYLAGIDASQALMCDMNNGTGDPKGDAFAPATVLVGDIAPQKHAPGWIDVCVAASPVVRDGIYYHLDYEGRLYAVDFQARKCIWRQDLTDLKPMLHENAVGVAAGPAVAGKYLFVQDNQGNMVVLEPGRQFKQIAANKLETYVPRKVTIPFQEMTTYAAPVFEGDHIYIRGEANLYCIGKK